MSVDGIRQGYRMLTTGGPDMPGDDPAMRKWVRSLGSPPKGWGRYIFAQVLLTFLVNILWP